MLAAKFVGFQVLDPAGPAKNELARTRIDPAGFRLLTALLFGIVLTLLLRRRVPIR
jgi:hypothetical protein